MENTSEKCIYFIDIHSHKKTNETWCGCGEVKSEQCIGVACGHYSDEPLLPRRL